MINKAFEPYKIKRAIKQNGQEFIFKRAKSNKFKEPTNEDELVGKIKGLYHEENSYIQITTGDTTRTRTKKIPMILCLWEKAEELSLKVDDFVEINNKKFKVTGIVNVQEWNIAVDISLEVVDNGIST